MMTMNDDYPRAVLRRHDGVDTLYVEDRAGHPHLGWMLIGQCEDFAIVLEAEVSWDDVATLSESPTTDPATLLEQHAGSEAQLRLMTPHGGGTMHGPLPAAVTARWALEVALDLTQASSPADWTGKRNVSDDETNEMEQLLAAV